MNRRHSKRRLSVLLGTIAVVLAVGVCSGAFLFTQRDAEGLAFVEQEGDASVLDRVSVTGILSDAFHRVAFASHGQDFTHRTLRQVLYAEPPAYNLPLSYYYEPLPGAKVEQKFYASGEAIEGPDGSTSSLATPIICETADRFMLYLTTEFSDPSYPYHIRTQVTYHKKITTQYDIENGEKGRWMQTDFSWDFYSRDLVQINGKQYAATATDADCRGTGGIYDLTELSREMSQREGNEPVMMQKENLYPIDLQDGKNEIVSMEACGEKLAVFIRADGRMTIRIVNPGTWKTEQIIALPDWEADSQYSDYRVDNNIMILTRWIEPEQPEYPGEAFAGPSAWKADIVDLERGAVVCQMEEPERKADEETSWHLTDAQYDGETLFCLYLTEKAENIVDAELDYREPARIPYLIAYRDGGRVFSCAIQSGQQEDKRCKTPNVRQYAQLKLQKGGEGFD